MYESTPMVPLYFQATLRSGCPGCFIHVEVYSHVGLTVDRCSMKFTDTTTAEALHFRAVPTPGSNARIVTLSFRTKVSINDTLWLDYKLPDIRVSAATTLPTTREVVSYHTLY